MSFVAPPPPHRKGDMSIDAYMENATKAARQREAKLEDEVASKEREKQELRSQLQRARCRPPAPLVDPGD